MITLSREPRQLRGDYSRLFWPRRDGQGPQLEGRPAPGGGEAQGSLRVQPARLRRNLAQQVKKLLILFIALNLWLYFYPLPVLKLAFLDLHAEICAQLAIHFM